GAGSGGRWVRRDGGEVSRPGLLGDSPRRQKIFQGGGDVLVGNDDLVFQGVQLRVVEYLPPAALEQGVARLGGFPVLIFLVGRWSGHRRNGVFGGEIATGR